VIRVRDALGATVALDGPARRVVSLVPSVTETLFALGCGDRVAGRTTFCVHPADQVRAVPVVGGTKDPDVARIRELAPDLVLANREENRREDVEAMGRAGLRVHVSYPRDLASLASYLDALGALLGAEDQASATVEAIERARRSHRRPDRPARALYLIWREPWMAAGKDTFVDAMLAECGFENVAAGEGRYPAIDLSAYRDAGLDGVLLSSEPFPFGERHRAEVAARAGLPLARVQLVSGEAFSWFGCRTAGAFDEAARVLAALRARS
jgi:ABC-type Fe3+-hydroxamate transport system substrate-binding protein